MNKEFIKKMLMAEKLRYEAIKEILPSRVKEHLDEVEKNTIEVLKDIALEVVRDSSQTYEDKLKRETKKVNVDFS